MSDKKGGDEVVAPVEQSLREVAAEFGEVV
jgi:hypothetical protein